MAGSFTTQPPVAVQLLQVPDCPLVEGVRALVEESARGLGLEVDVADIVGDYPSPTVVIDGRDVTTGRTPSGDASCRLDLPTADQVATALQRATAAR